MGILDFLLPNHGKDHQKSFPDINHDSPISQVDDEIYDFIVGYEFIADLDAFTTLVALNHHRKTVGRIKESKLPNYKYGIWLEIIKDQELGIPTIEELRYLEFLKRFRKTYESNLTTEKKFEILTTLFKEFDDLPTKLHASDWYLWDLMEIQGISASIAESLYYYGLKSKVDIEQTSDEVLLKITGIGPGRLKQIRAFFSKDEKFEIYKPEQTQIETSSSNLKIPKAKAIIISWAKVIRLPLLKYERGQDSLGLSNSDRSQYEKSIKDATIYYNTARYIEAKDELLKIRDWQHMDDTYSRSLLKSYRKLIEGKITSKAYDEALLYLVELLKYCPNNKDIKTYNNLVIQQNKLQTKAKLPLIEPLADEPDFKITSGIITYITKSKKPKGYKSPALEGTSFFKLISLSEYLPESLPHIVFGNNRIYFNDLNSVPQIPYSTYRFRESTKQDAFLSSSKELKINLYNWNLELLKSFDASCYCDQKTHLRRIDLSSDLSYFLFTIIDTAYLLDAEMNLVHVWQVPYKDGFEKREIQNSKEKPIEIKECLKLLELHDKPSKEEIKLAFRKLVIKWHPDRNPDNPLAEEKTRELIEAYEFLTGEEAQRVFDGIGKEDYYWVDLSRITRIESGGISMEIAITLGTGEDWIYGSGISSDGSRIYLGCYSGKIYQINQKGIAEKIYVIPKETISDYQRTNPIVSVTEYLDRIYIQTNWYLYILKGDKLISYYKNDKGRYKWFKNGFINQGPKQIVLYDRDGIEKGILSFKSPVLHVCYYDNVLLVETTTMAFSFCLNYQ